MYKSFDKNAARLKRHLRSKVVGTSDCPRISIFRSNTNIYAQIIDDVKHVTLCSSSSFELKLTNGGNKEGAAKVGADLAEKVVFDRSGYVYHGRVAALAEAAREAGLEF